MQQKTVFLISVLMLLSVLLWAIPVAAETVTIAQIQETANGLAGPSPYEGQEVTFSGVVTRRTMNNYFVQDGSGPWSGILINHFFNSVAEGDNVTLTGFVSESNGMTMLSMPATTINSNGNPIPDATVITNADMGEAYEGVIIKINNGECIGINGQEWKIDDTTGLATVGTYCTVYTPTVGTVYNVTGIGNETIDGYRINPRSEFDIEVVPQGPSVVTIAQIQETPNGLAGPSPYEGQEVTFSGVVTRRTMNNYFVQDGSGPWSGILINHFFNNVAQGDNVTLTGFVSESNGMTMLSMPATTINSNGNPIPDATVITNADMGEAYEGVIIKINNGECIGINGQEWKIDDTTGLATVGTYCTVYTPTVGTVYNVTGIGNETIDGYRINPRSEFDIEVVPQGPSVVTIAQIQETPDGLAGPSPYDGQEVTFSGVVTRRTMNNYFVQDGSGPWSGILISHFFNNVAQGDNVTLTGFVSESNGMTMLSMPATTINSNGNPIPDATVITNADMGEAYEGVIIKINNGECIGINGQEWKIDDTTGLATVGTYCTVYTPTVGTVYNVTGIGNETIDGYRINPRSASDIEVVPQGPSVVTIAQIQQTPDGQAGPSPYEGQEVTFSGVVTRRTMNNYFVQDGSGPWSGILINHFFNNVAQGDNVTLTGFVSESNGMTVVSTPATTINSTNNPIPDATVITGADMGEAYEGVIIKINNGECIGINGQEWKIDDTTGLATVGTYCMVYTPTVGTVYNVTGIGNETIDGYRINPRSANDIEVVPQGPSVVTIAQIQETPDGQAGPSPYEGQEVTFSGVVTRRTMNNYFVQDGSGPWSGILINHFFNSVAEGDNVTLTGFVSESDGMTMLSMPATTINSNGNPIPDATVITNADMGEAYEGVIIKINNGECIGINGQEWKIDDTTGLATVGTYCMVYTPTIGTVYNVTGIGNETIDGYRINPRSASDIEVVPQGPSVVTIAQIQETANGLAGPSPYEGQEVTFSGVVTRRTMNNYFVQDGSGPWSGILINHFFNNVAQGDNVTLTGFVSESNGMTVVSTPATTINSTNNPIPFPTVITSADMGEAWEGVIIKINNAECLSITGSEWKIEDSTGIATVGAFCTVYTPIVGTIYNVSGIGNETIDGYRINPRSANDIEVVPQGPSVVTIAQIQETPNGLAGPSPYEGQEVTFSGVVTYRNIVGYVVQDGSGPWTAIYVQDNYNTYSVGQNLTITGVVSEYSDITLSEMTVITAPSEVVINSNGNPLPQPVDIVTTQLGEPYESVLITIHNADCISTNMTEWTIQDSIGIATVGNFCYTVFPNIGSNYTVTGLGNQEVAGYRINPRNNSDVIDNSPTPTAVTIAEIQETPDGQAGPSPYEGEHVAFTGRITFRDADGYFIQDGTGPWSGVYVSHPGNNLGQGYMVEMQGLVSEIDGMTSITQPIILNVLSNSGNLPYYTWITADELGEAWEGVYLSILHAECTAINGTEWNIQDSTGTATVGDFCYTSSPAVGSTYNLIGMGSETADGYRFNPRSAGDLQAPPIVTISDIQQTANGQTGPSPYMGQDVTFSGIVTQCYQNRIYVQDAPGAWNGIPVYADMPYEIGDHVTVSGIVNEPAGMTMIMVVRALQKNSSGNPLPAAASITTADLDEPWEGVLITMDNAECTAINGDEWEINDGSGPAIVGNLFYGATPEIGSVYRVSGVADQAATGYRINPRNTDDVEPLGPFDVTIAQIQQTATGQAGPSPYEDLEVTFDGVVTYRSMNSYFVQDGAGPWNGVMVSQFFNGVAAGDSITVTGMVTESNGMTTITQPAAIVHASGATLPAPVMITNADLAEAYEGVLIAVNDAECVAINGNEWDIDDATAIATVGAYCHVASPTIGTAYNVTGIGNETANGYRINPRNADDVVESFSYQYDLEALSLTGPQYALYNQATEYIMNIHNNGSEMATGYTVDFLVNGSAVYSTPGSTLQSGESMNYSFFWTPDTTSTFEVASKIVYALDEKPSNNMSNILDVISITQNGSQVVQVGNAGTYSFSRLPANLDNDYNLSQQLFYQDELQTSGRLANIKFFTRFEVADVIEPMKIWMAETDETSLANGWIPFSEFTLVYDGMVAYPFMEGSVVIDLDAPFEYSGNHNLVMMVQINKQYPTPYYWCDYYYTDTPDHPDRSLFLTSQDPFNVVTPPAGETRAQHSNVGLYFWTQQTGSLEGVITDASNQPMPCVEVSFGPDFFTTETDANGAYFFPYVFEGTEDVTASIYGYYDNIQTVTIQPDQANYCDFVMTELPKVTVTGQLVANYDPAVTIANAEISLSGYQNYSTTSDANGFFSIDEVYADKEYTFAASADLFQDYSQMIVVPATNYDMGQVVMDESPIQPGNIFAQEQPNGDNLVQWTLPGQGYPEYEIAYDHNFPTSAMHWTELGGECAVRFTPFGYPCTVTGGSVNIWDGSWPQGVQLLPFDIAVYDDDGVTPNPNVPDDFPGTELARITVTPDAFGWVTFDFSDDNIVLEDGDFYISFIQTAQAPQAPPIAVDSLDPAYHNYIMYPGSTWMGFTEYYNDFMIRALVEGPGTNQFNPQPRQLMPVAHSGKEQNCIQMAPSTATCIPQEQPCYRHDDNTDSVENYNLYRMAVGDEYTPAAWTQLASAISDTFYVDTQWASLADDTYRYAVQAIYYNGVPSVYTFSDSVEKGLTTSLVCNLSTNSGEDTQGAELVILQQDGDHNYQYTVPAGNSITVPAIYKGTYTIKAYLSEFEDYLATDVAITEPTTLSIELQEIIYQITNLQAQDAGDDIQLSWNWQGPSSVLFVDDDGSFNHPGCFDTQPLYTALLDTLGITYDVMELTIDMGDGPTAAEMMPYDLVIWETGEHYSDSRTLTVNDELNLATYLDAGGRLLLSAQDYLWDRYPEMFNLFPGDFPFEYLGVWGCAQDQVLVGSMPNGVPQATLFGAPESFIEGLSVGIIDVFTPPTDDGVFIDVLVPQDDASSYAKIDGHAVAVKTRNTIFTTASIASMVDGANRVADILNGSTRGFFIPSLFRTFQSFTISRDGEVIAEDVTELSFVDEDVIDGTYTYEVVANFTTASSAPISITVEVTGHTSAHNGMAPVPTALNGNYPNPFNPETTISYSLQQESDVTLAIYNARGQLVRTLVDSHQDAGSYSARWDGTDNSQKTVASGIYFYRMNTETYQKTRKMILLK